ncbi:MAG: ABC transporter substrate-binding protein [Dehalococcoidia bacterium]|nr:ABC transporter substrate-binding protein [Dehalococcoidia bacterium]
MTSDESTDRSDLFGTFSRKALLRGGALGAAGLAAAALIGCGGDEEEAAPAGGAASSATAAAQSGTPADGITVAGKLIPFNFPEPAGKTPKAGGTATFAVTWDVSTMDPSKSAAGGTVTVPNVVYNRLLGFKRGPSADPFKLEIVPELAKSWEQSPDGLTYTFKLEPNVKWQNIAPLSGRAFTAADVKFVYERLQKEGVHRPYFTNVKSVDAPDATTVKITLNKPQPDFLIPLASRYTTIHPKELVDSGEIDKKAIGTGPMILKEAASGVGATFDKSPDYWMGKVLIDSLVCKVQTDGAAQLAAFRAKQIEFGYTVGTTVIELETLLKTNPDIQANTAQPVTNTFALSFNLDLPKWQDVRTRRAVSMIMDRKEIIDIALRTYGVSTPTMPWIFIFDKPPTAESGQLGKWWKTDVAEAKKLLEAAGQSNLEMQMIYYNYGDSSNKSPNEVLVNQFQKAGVKLDARSVDYTEFNSQWVGAKFPDVADGWAAQGFDTDNFFYQHVRSDSPGNRWRIKDTELDAWAEQQRSEIDRQKRKEILRKIWDKTLDQAYRIEKPSAIAATVYQPWLRGVRWVGVLGANSYYYDIGAQLTSMWLDK